MGSSWLVRSLDTVTCAALFLELGDSSGREPPSGSSSHGRFISGAMISDKLPGKSSFWEKGSFWLTVLSKSPPFGAVETEN